MTTISVEHVVYYLAAASPSVRDALTTGTLAVTIADAGDYRTASGSRYELVPGGDDRNPDVDDDQTLVYKNGRRLLVADIVLVATTGHDSYLAGGWYDESRGGYRGCFSTTRIAAWPD